MPIGCLLVVTATGCTPSALTQHEQGGSAPRTVRAHVQMRPGGPVEDVEMPIHEAPVDLPTVTAAEAPLKDDDLVLGVVIDGESMAYPIGYLAMFEVVNGRVGEAALAPTW